LAAGQGGAGFDAAFGELIGIAHAHLRSALAYTLLIPGEEGGIRRFCLWAVGLAVLTLRKIHGTPGFTSGGQVKVSRSAVAWTRTLTSIAVRSDWLLRFLFERAASGLPLAAPGSLAAPAAAGRASGRGEDALRPAPRNGLLDGGVRRSEARSAH
jgi:farnesyl-diphosphate farnesyltransferase